MFTGIVEKKVAIRFEKNASHGLRASLACPKGWTLKKGDSLAVSGVCLTVADKKGSTYFFDIIPETLKKTTFASLPALVNIERSLKAGDRVHGHTVTGHVDCVGTVALVAGGKAGRLMTISFPKKFDGNVVARGSITVDGVSLTVARLAPQKLTVALVPHTLKVTTLGTIGKSDKVNLEFDILSKYALQRAKKIYGTAK